ncbi:phosphoglycerate mutase family protein [Aeromicrobium marinum DSM 15272]|uniref:Phosphoglycerate mutase family protein n=1 Tax=Aeromicrobium marinum DSM 15272 TaxID=585531 RepID=E2SAW3_9ACTN|nr:histidine phosphatase family protein [Aeromicrobium marinum]EFQ83509.1 phosphoglycerate mutase family protein [Aeromicrobium marinum DSM 15272]
MTSPTSPVAGWRGRGDADPLTLVLLRHGVTTNTVGKLFCGSGGTDPGLTAEGEAQAERAAEHLHRLGQVEAIVSSPLRRTQETAGIVARRLGMDVELEPGLAEAAFGEWDGHGFTDIMQKWPAEMDAWLGSTSVAPPGGESFDDVSARAEEALTGLVDRFAGKTVVAVSHVTPIKLLVRLALDSPMHVIHRMELAPASLTTIAWWPGGAPSLRAFSHVP